MRWRMVLELVGPDGTPQWHEVGSGERSPAGHTAATLGLRLEEGKEAEEPSRGVCHAETMLAQIEDRT